MNNVFDIIFGDKHFLVINKIARIVVQPSPKKEKQTLTSLVEKHLKEKLYICHRLDKDTQGLIIMLDLKKCIKILPINFEREKSLRNTLP